ncbi:MAG: hypothetical protein A2849_02920 [Candidatus Taylorbacteria bacterium RIFCSPHIGHO2_01_FULL_51_15]|uniref:Uncharacterized protein n=1 Tax=Candidatus Taylorbacteria bacterium RIFCSPHIGHO2_01_FULL_51_15 TaxID=1802304 RepID=A0A1G2M8K4_9BACT|nr:MAG: hypothetical protein A2849_02920 [Candidatus Taylorbacteria bacterium RIFCSPHIGHO2_01_FULL_51_15]
MSQIPTGPYIKGILLRQLLAAERRAPRMIHANNGQTATNGTGELSELKKPLPPSARVPIERKEAFVRPDVHVARPPRTFGGVGPP